MLQPEQTGSRERRMKQLALTQERLRSDSIFVLLSDHGVDDEEEEQQSTANHQEQDMIVEEIDHVPALKLRAYPQICEDDDQDL